MTWPHLSAGLESQDQETEAAAFLCRKSKTLYRMAMPHLLSLRVSKPPVPPIFTGSPNQLPFPPGYHTSETQQLNRIVIPLCCNTVVIPQWQAKNRRPTRKTIHSVLCPKHRFIGSHTGVSSRQVSCALANPPVLWRSTSVPCAPSPHTDTLGPCRYLS